MRGLIALAALALAWGAPAAADTLIDNVKGMTATPFGQVIHFSALLIGDDGKVVRTYAEGERVDVRPKYRVDGRRRRLMPSVMLSFPDVGSLIPLGLSRMATRAGLKGPLPKPGPRDRDAAFEVIQNYLLSNGITTVTDMGTSVEDWLVFRRAGDEGRLRLKIMCYANGIEPIITITGGKPTPWLYNDHLRMAGVLIDGHIKSGKLPITAKNDETRLRNEMSRAAMDGFQVAAGVATLAEIDRIKSARAELSTTYQGEWRWRIWNGSINNKQLMLTIWSPNPESPEKLIEQAEAARGALIGDRVALIAPNYHADFLIIDEQKKSGNPETDAANAVSEMVANGGALHGETWVDGVKVYERTPAAPVSPTTPSASPQ